MRPFLTEIVMAGAEEGSSVGAVKEGEEVTLLCRYFFKLNLKIQHKKINELCDLQSERIKAPCSDHLVQRNATPQKARRRRDSHSGNLFLK